MVGSRKHMLGTPVIRRSASLRPPRHSSAPITSSILRFLFASSDALGRNTQSALRACKLLKTKAGTWPRAERPVTYEKPPSLGPGPSW